MTGDRDASSLILTTTPQQEIVQYSDFNVSHVARCNLADSFGHLVEQFLFLWCRRPALSKYETRLFCWDSDGTRVNSTFLPNTATYTSDSADHRERYEVDEYFSLLNSMQHLEPLGEGNIIPTVHSVPITFGSASFQSGQLSRWKTSKAMRCWTLKHPGQLEVT